MSSDIDLCGIANMDRTFVDFRSDIFQINPIFSTTQGGEEEQIKKQKYKKLAVTHFIKLTSKFFLGSL